MGLLGYLLFTCFVFFTVRCIEAASTACPYLGCPPCAYGQYHRYRYDWRGCQECYCEWETTAVMASTVAACPYPACPTCDYNYYYHNFRINWRGCQECYCEWKTTTTSAPAVATGASWEPHPANYWSMSRSSLLSILLNMKQEAQSLIDSAKNTYDHILHSVIVNDVRKRREPVREEETKK